MAPRCLFFVFTWQLNFDSKIVSITCELCQVSTYDLNHDLNDGPPPDFINKTVEAKINAEQTAALRSLKTNLFLIFVFMLPLLLFVAFKFQIQLTFGYCLLLSIQKGFVTIFSTIANFGTIREVMKKYWDNIRKRNRSK
jgi:hypothetical protein